MPINTKQIKIYCPLQFNKPIVNYLLNTQLLDGSYYWLSNGCDEVSNNCKCIACLKHAETFVNQNPNYDFLSTVLDVPCPK